MFIKEKGENCQWEEFVSSDSSSQDKGKRQARTRGRGGLLHWDGCCRNPECQAVGADTRALLPDSGPFSLIRYFSKRGQK